MKRAASVAFLVALSSAPALAQNKPNAERIRSAAEEYDAGRRAYNDAKFEEAAIHFENAFHDAPAPQAIRNAINARREAKHYARAATAAALAQTKYPEDQATKDLVGKVLAELEPKLQKIVLTCTPECGVVADGRAVSIEDAGRIVFYLDPGDHEISAGWTEDRTKTRRVNGKAGTQVEISLEAPPIRPKTPSADSGGGGAGTLGPSEQPVETSRKPFGPIVFVIGSVLTVGGGVATIASGVDALNNPGTERVKTACAGKGEQCPEYQQGLAAQTRTNVILGATIGVGVLTAIVGIFLTQWSSPARKSGESARVRPFVEIGTTSHFGLQGTF